MFCGGGGGGGSVQAGNPVNKQLNFPVKSNRFFPSRSHLYRQAYNLKFEWLPRAPNRVHLPFESALLAFSKTARGKGLGSSMEMLLC